MNWITLKLMRYQLKKAKRQQDQEEYDIIARAYRDLIKSYETAILFLEANN